MIQLEKLKSATRLLTIEFENIGSIEVEYSQVALCDEETQRMSTEMATVTDRKQLMDCFARMFVRVVVWRDLYDGETPYALAVDNIKALPIYVLQAIFKSITDNEAGGNPIAKSANV